MSSNDYLGSNMFGFDTYIPVTGMTYNCLANNFAIVFADQVVVALIAYYDSGD